jgi:hypothetical protein
MATLLLGSFIYLVIFLIGAYLISERATKDVIDQKLKSEYRK